MNKDTLGYLASFCDVQTLRSLALGSKMFAASIQTLIERGRLTPLFQNYDRTKPKGLYGKFDLSALINTLFVYRNPHDTYKKRINTNNCVILKRGRCRVRLKGLEELCWFHEGQSYDKVIIVCDEEMVKIRIEYEDHHEGHTYYCDIALGHNYRYLSKESLKSSKIPCEYENFIDPSLYKDY